MASTPPPPEVRTPTAPLHGSLFDPSLVCNRKSDRIKNRKRAEHTPSPDRNATSFDSEGPGELKRTPRAKRSSPQFLSHLSPPSSPLGPDSTTESSTLFTNSKKTSAQSLRASSGHMEFSTPMKTPRKRNLQAGATDTARALFSKSQHEAQNPSDTFDGGLTHLPTPMSKKRSKRTRRNVGFSLDDEMDRDTMGRSGDIEIYTDSREMIPELDDSRNNPFYARPGEPKKVYTRRQARTKDAQTELNGIKLLEEDNGYLAVGRGRRFWKRIQTGDKDVPSSPLHSDDERQRNEEASRLNEEDGNLAQPEPNSDHFHRRNLRPRRLFADDTNTGDNEHGDRSLDEQDDDAEAVTDIEEPEKHGLSSATLPVDSKASKLFVNVEGKESIVDAQMAGIRSDGSLPSTSTREAISIPSSPFDNWPRRKPTRSRAAAKTDIPGTASKRQGETLAPVAKRARDTAK